MKINGPIVIIEQDLEEQLLLREIIINLGYHNTIIFIENTSVAISMIREIEQPFVVLSAINLSGLNGFEIRDLILTEEPLLKKCTPFIFYSAHANDKMCDEVARRNAQGYIHDVNDYIELNKQIDAMMSHCKASYNMA